MVNFLSLLLSTQSLGFIIESGARGLLLAQLAMPTKDGWLA